MSSTSGGKGGRDDRGGGRGYGGPPRFLPDKKPDGQDPNDPIEDFSSSPVRRHQNQRPQQQNQPQRQQQQPPQNQPPRPQNQPQRQQQQPPQNQPPRPQNQPQRQQDRIPQNPPRQQNQLPQQQQQPRPNPYQERGNRDPSIPRPNPYQERGNRDAPAPRPFNPQNRDRGRGDFNVASRGRGQDMNDRGRGDFNVASRGRGQDMNDRGRGDFNVASRGRGQDMNDRGRGDFNVASRGRGQDMNDRGRGDFNVASRGRGQDIAARGRQNERSRSRVATDLGQLSQRGSQNIVGNSGGGGASSSQRSIQQPSMTGLHQRNPSSTQPGHPRNRQSWPAINEIVEPTGYSPRQPQSMRDPPVLNTQSSQNLPSRPQWGMNQANPPQHLGQTYNQPSPNPPSSDNIYDASPLRNPSRRAPNRPVIPVLSSPPAIAPTQMQIQATAGPSNVSRSANTVDDDSDQSPQPMRRSRRPTTTDYESQPQLQRQENATAGPSNQRNRSRPAPVTEDSDDDEIMAEYEPAELDIPVGRSILPTVGANVANQSTLTCVVIQDYESQGTIALDGNGGNETISINQYEEGYTFGGPRQDGNGNSFRLFNLARTQQVGWVPQACLKPGQPSGNVKIITNDLAAAVDPHLADDASRLEKTVLALLECLRNNKNSIINEGGAANTFDHLGKNVHLYYREIMSCMQEPVRKVMKDGRYSFSQLWDMAIKNESSRITYAGDDRVVIYTILLKGIDGYPDRNAIYHGKTINSGSRFGNHRDGLREDSTGPGQLYKYGRRASEWKMVVWWDFSKFSNNVEWRDRLLQVTEFISVALDKSWNPDLFQYFGSDKSNWILDAANAVRFRNMAQETFEVTDWQPCSGDWRGTNWKTPLMDLQTLSTIWVCTTVRLQNGHDVSVYRRGPLKVTTFSSTNPNHRDEPNLKVNLIAGGGAGLGRVEIVSSRLPDAGTMVYPIVEIYEGEHQRHPIPWPVAPEPGPTSDWGDLNRIGIRFEWEEEDGWKTAWAQIRMNHAKLDWLPRDRDALPPHHREAYDHITQPYCKARLLWNTLKQASYPPDADLPPWIRQGPPILVRTTTYDHLTQTLTIGVQTPIIIQPPTLRSFNENTKFLFETYGSLDGIDFFVGDLPSTSGPHSVQPNAKVRSCLMCQSARCVVLPAVTTGPMENRHAATCEKCFTYRRPCVTVLPQVAFPRDPRLKYLHPFRDPRGAETFNRVGAQDGPIDGE